MPIIVPVKPRWDHHNTSIIKKDYAGIVIASHALPQSDEFSYTIVQDVLTNSRALNTSFSLDLLNLSYLKLLQGSTVSLQNRF